MVNAATEKTLRVELLGSLLLWRDGKQLLLGAGRLRALLGILATRRNQVVSRDELIDALWGDHPPASVENAVHVYVARLRRVLEPGRVHRAPAQLLVSTESGYLLRLAPDQLDVEVFDTHRAQGDRLWSAGDLAGAVRSLDAALALWRGQPWAGVPGPFAQMERVRLSELRLSVLEKRAEILLALGRHVELVVELSSLVYEHPLRESLRVFHMQALYRSGRQADALAVFHDARRLLITELGIEPGSDLRYLHQRILVNDPELDISITVRATSEST